MQKQHLLKEQNGASLKPETHTPSFALDFAVVVIDEMTVGEGMNIASEPTLKSHLASRPCGTCLSSSPSRHLLRCVPGYSHSPPRGFTLVTSLQPACCNRE